MKIVPISGTKNRVFVTIDKEEKVSTGGIIFIEDAEKGHTTGIVSAVSDRDENGTPPNVEVGDYVYFSEHAGKEHVIENELYLILKEAEIYARRERV